MKRKIVLTEQQIINTIRKVINEARRNPETNIDESFAEFYNRMIDKAPLEDIFVSFRDSTNVTDVNPVNKYNTPTGFYSYPLSSFNILENPTEAEFRRKFLFANDKKYINFFILKTHEGVLTSGTDESTLNEYAERIKKLYPNRGEVEKLCNSFIDGSYSSGYTKVVHHMTHLFWLFLYDIANAIQDSNIQNRINLICRKIGVNGFIDYEGNRYIHRLEPEQAVFFKVKSLGEVFIYEKTKISGNAVNNAIQNKEYEIIKALKDDINLIKLFDKYGLVNKDGELINKQLFQWIDTFKNGFAHVILNDKYNFINQNGKILSKQGFDWVHYFDNGIAKVELNDKYNFINQKGELLFSDKWLDNVMDFDGGFAAIKLNDKGWNFINQKGEILFPNQWFDSVRSFGENTAHVILQGKSYQLDISTGDMHQIDKKRRERKSSYEKHKADLNKKIFNEIN